MASDLIPPAWRVWPPLLTVAPIARASGQVRLPGSKSISNRALLLASLAQGQSELLGVLDADDTRVMIAALRTLGIAIARDGDTVRVTGCRGVIPVRDADLHLGNAGTAMRPLTAALAFAGGRYRLDGVARMRERPIGDLVDAMNALGANIFYQAAVGYPPLRIEPSTAARGDRVQVRGAVSSQFVSALLMAAPLIAPKQGLTIEIPGALISEPYVEITRRVMAQFGASVQGLGQKYIVAPGVYRAPVRLVIEGDASGASYFLAAGVLAGGPVRVLGVGRDSIQGDTAFAHLLERMGAAITWGADWIEASRGAPLRSVEYDCTEIPDAAMTAGVLALFASGTTRLTGIGSWRVKETDRIAAMATELRKLGASVDVGADWIAITPPAAGVLREATIDTYDDHRMAMCFALAASGGMPIHIRDPKCVAKTYPGYFDQLAAITHNTSGNGGATAAASTTRH
jgi:3-phosphoshikimate 1-carboxyvinyltransferase